MTAGVATILRRRGRSGDPNRGRVFQSFWIYVVCVVLGAITLIPLLYVVLGGFRTTGQIAAHPVAWPHPWITSNYTSIATSGAFWRQIGNSAIIAGIATLVIVTLGSSVAYALARYDFRGREILYTVFTLGLLLPLTVAVLPLYIELRQFGILDNPLGVALPEAAFGLPVTVIILRPFMRAIPSDLEDAAAIDGCSKIGFFWRILIPLSRPALMTVAVLAVVTSWNAFLLPLIVLNNPNDWTLPLGVAAYQGEYAQDTAAILAYTALSMVPALIFFMGAERRIVRGLSGAVKG
ncbi:MAG TPA: carbohydrate ABC transporter permease [Gaiellaceae bacterium]